MSWSAPKTFTANSVLTAADLNTYLRDNSLMTVPSIATTPSSYFIVSALNTIAERVPSSDYVPNSETTTATGYVGLSTVGPTVSVTTGPSAFVFLAANTLNTSTNATWYSVGITGATTVVASDGTALMMQGSSGLGQHTGTAILMRGLNSGINTFTAKYRVSGGTGTFSERRLAVMPL